MIELEVLCKTSSFKPKFQMITKATTFSSGLGRQTFRCKAKL